MWDIQMLFTLSASAKFTPKLINTNKWASKLETSPWSPEQTVDCRIKIRRCVVVVLAALLFVPPNSVFVATQTLNRQANHDNDHHQHLIGNKCQLCSSFKITNKDLLDRSMTHSLNLTWHVRDTCNIIDFLHVEASFIVTACSNNSVATCSSA